MNPLPHPDRIHPDRIHPLRIDTVMDTDTLLVLGGGRLLEQGPPAELAARPDGSFARMVNAAAGFDQQH